MLLLTIVRRNGVVLEIAYSMVLCESVTDRVSVNVIRISVWA